MDSQEENTNMEANRLWCNEGVNATQEDQEET